MIPKKPRPFGRTGQLNKSNRLQRRRLGQWVAQPQVARVDSETRYTLALAEWGAK